MKRRTAAVAAAGLLIASCGGDGDSGPPQPSYRVEVVKLAQGVAPEHLTAAPDGRLWVTDGGRVAAVDPQTKKLASAPRTVRPSLYDIAAGDAGVWAAARDGSKVIVLPLDSRTGRPGRRIALEGFDPVSLRGGDYLKLAVGAGRVWAAAYDETYSVIVPLPTGRQIDVSSSTVEDVAAGGGAGWLITEEEEPGSSGGSLDRVDPRTGQAKTVTVEDSPIAVTHGVGSVWVLFEDSVKRYEEASGREVATIDLEGLDASGGDIAVGGGTVWVVAGTSRRAAAVEVESNELSGGTVPLPGGDPRDLAATPESAWITMADGRFLRLGR